MPLYDSPFDIKKMRAAQAAKAAPQFSGSNTPEFNKPFNYRNVERVAKPMQSELDAVRRKVVDTRPAAPQPKAPASPGPASRVGTAAKNTGGKVVSELNKARGVKPPTGGMIARGATRLGNFARGGLALGAAVSTGLALGDAIKDTPDSPNPVAAAGERALADSAGTLFGLDARENAIMSQDPAVAKKAIAEQNYRTQMNRPETPAGQGGTQAPAAVPTANPGSPEATVDNYTLANSAPPNSELNAARPAQIPGSEYQSAGQYGNASVLRKTGANGEASFTDTNTAFNRPTAPATAQEQAAEAARVQQARDEYAANTTMSDGRRAFGGPENEALANAQIANSEQGKNLDTITQQLNDQGLTPEQRAAYKADPAAAYQVDATANATSARSQLDAYKLNYNMQRNASTDSRLGRTAAMKEATSALDAFKSYPDVHAKMMAMAAQQYDQGGGQESMTNIVSRLLSSLETDGGIPTVDEQGQLVQRGKDVAQAPHDIDAFL